MPYMIWRWVGRRRCSQQHGPIWRQTPTESAATANADRVSNGTTDRSVVPWLQYYTDRLNCYRLALACDTKKLPGCRLAQLTQRLLATGRV